MMQNTKMKQNSNLRDIPTEKGCNTSDVWVVLLFDAGDFALYLNKSGGVFSGFEVHRIRVRKARTVRVKDCVFSVPDRRVIARSNEFGLYAWCYPNLDTVFQKHPLFMPYASVIREKLITERDKLCGVMKNNAIE